MMQYSYILALVSGFDKLWLLTSNELDDDVIDVTALTPSINWSSPIVRKVYISLFEKHYNFNNDPMNGCQDIHYSNPLYTQQNSHFIVLYLDRQKRGKYRIVGIYIFGRLIYLCICNISKVLLLVRNMNYIKKIFIKENWTPPLKQLFWTLKICYLHKTT